jgi:hypothetical protein
MVKSKRNFKRNKKSRKLRNKSKKYNKSKSKSRKYRGGALTYQQFITTFQPEDWNIDWANGFVNYVFQRRYELNRNNFENQGALYAYMRDMIQHDPGGNDDYEILIEMYNEYIAEHEMPDNPREVDKPDASELPGTPANYLGYSLRTGLFGDGPRFNVGAAQPPFPRAAEEPEAEDRYSESTVDRDSESTVELDERGQIRLRDEDGDENMERAKRSR